MNGHDDEPRIDPIRAFETGLFVRVELPRALVLEHAETAVRDACNADWPEHVAKIVQWLDHVDHRSGSILYRAAEVMLTTTRPVQTGEVPDAYRSPRD